MGSATHAEEVPSQRFIEHWIADGDTLFLLAVRYGSSVQLLVDANGIADVRKLQVGSLLRVPLIPLAPPPSLPVRAVASTKINRIEVESLIERGEKQLRDARFEAALESADAARALLGASPTPSEKENRVRLEIVSATAAVALGDHDAARSSLRRALQANPDLTLDPALVSPKVLRALRAARRHPR
jgi:murein DD-endopeptidase MepM/ murein hydrolase activator NlpD